jgi:hypothetical protein
MKKITIILPIHKLEVDYIGMLNNALYSVEGFHNDVKVTIVCPVGLKPKMSGIAFGNNLEVKVLYNSDLKTDFMTQVNMGINDCDTEWFSILEVDDEYTKAWFPSMTEHMNAYGYAQENRVDVFLPIVKDVNVEGKFLTYMNESLWAYGFSDKQGYLDNALLLEYQNYQTSGGLYRTQVIKDNGCFKDNIKLTFSYEFLLRLTNNGVVIMTVPKVGYQHVNFRENSLFWMYKHDEKEKLGENEAKFWLETAKKEYFFKNKRDVNYTEV